MMIAAITSPLSFSQPWWLLLLLLIPVLYFVRKRRDLPYFPSLNLPVEEAGLRRGKSFRTKLPGFSGVLMSAAWVSTALGMAGPQWTERGKDRYNEGIDIILAMDISLSMLARDFDPDRLEASKDVAARFIRERGPDRIGMVVFAGHPFTLCPLTADKAAMIILLQQAQAGFIEDGSTAIGDGIATAINRLRESDAKSKVIILITDGENNAGNIDPITAAELAKSFGIKTYTIGVGKGGLVPFPVDDPLFGRRYVQVTVDVDETVLKRIADITGGLFFRARDSAALSEIYEKINKLEKSEVKVKEYRSYNELFAFFLIPALILFLFEIFLKRTVLLKVP